MRRSEINALVRDASACFERHGWVLPPDPRWDVTDFGMGDWRARGLVLVNLAEEPEYCEKLMYAQRGMLTPMHAHARKKEDIIVRAGALRIRLAREDGPAPVVLTDEKLPIKRNGRPERVRSGTELVLEAGERITLVPGVYHEFAPESEEAIIGEVSTANDDANDNFFTDLRVGRFSEIEEDEPALVRLVSDPV